VKAALMPLNTWLPDAHAYAPHPVSAVLSGVMIKVSILAVWRVVTVLGLSRLQDLLLWIGAITAATAVIAALAQTDMKRILAFHSVSQMGYIAAGFGAATAAGYTGSAAHILSHSLFKGLLFLAVGAAIHVTGRRNLKELSGLARKLPLVFVCFAVGALSICGIPPFNGYVSKSLISAALKSRPAVYTLLWLASTGTVASFLKLSAAFLPGGFLPARDHAGRAEPRIGGAPVTGKPPPLMTIPLLVLSILCLATGLAGPFYANSLSMLAAGKELAKLPRFYSPPLLSGPLWAVGPGLALFLLIRTRAGESALGRIRLVRLDLETSLILVVSTVLVFFLLGLPVL